jgi:hypothetical protein
VVNVRGQGGEVLVKNNMVQAAIPFNNPLRRSNNIQRGCRLSWTARRPG